MRYSLFIIVLLFASCNAKPDLMTEKEFATILLDSLQSKYPSKQFSLQNDNCIVIIKDQKEDFQFFLDNAYIQFKQSPEKADQVINAFIAALPDLNHKQEKKMLVDDIMPVIKSQLFFDQAREATKGRGKSFELIAEKYTDELYVTYGLDHDNKIQFLKKEDLKELAVPEDSLRAIAVRNLYKKLPQMEKHGSDGYYMVTAGGYYESSLILLPTMWQKEKFPVTGDFVVAIPNRDILLITGSQDMKGLNILKKSVENSFNSGNYPISEHLYKWNGIKFELFEK